MYYGYVRTHTYVYTHAASSSLCAWVCACVRAYECVYVHVCVRVCVRVCMCVHKLMSSYYVHHNTLHYFSPAPGGVALMSIHSSSFWTETWPSSLPSSLSSWLAFRVHSFWLCNWTDQLRRIPQTIARSTILPCKWHTQTARCCWALASSMQYMLYGYCKWCNYA